MIEHSTKPVKQLHKGYIIGVRLMGIRPEYLNDPDPPTTLTSAIIRRKGDFVETQNTIYYVLDWYDDKDE